MQFTTGCQEDPVSFPSGGLEKTTLTMQFTTGCQEDPVSFPSGRLEKTTLTMQFTTGCQEDPVSFPSGRLEKTTRSSPHHMAQHVQQDLKQHHLTLPEAADLAQN